MADDLVIPNPPADLPRKIAQQLIHDEGWKPTPRPTPEEAPKRNPAKSGDGYDTCLNADCGSEVEMTRQLTPHVQQYRCSCCGTTHYTEDAVAHEKNIQNGYGGHSANLRTQAAATGRTFFTPSRKYSNNYERIDWSK